jgi:hypothetical protein
MDRREFTVTLLLGLLAAPLAAEAQPGDKVYRIGFLGIGSSRGPFHQVFEQAASPRRSTTGSLPSRPSWPGSSCR